MAGTKGMYRIGMTLIKACGMKKWWIQKILNLRAKGADFASSTANLRLASLSRPGDAANMASARDTRQVCEDIGRSEHFE